MSDETNRAVQAPTHAATAVIYGADASGMENQVSGEERGPGKDGPCTRHISPALIKWCSRVQSDRTVVTSWLLNKDDRLCMEKLQPELCARKSSVITNMINKACTLKGLVSTISLSTSTFLALANFSVINITDRE